MGGKERITVILPEELVSFTDDVARREHISRSRVISMYLQEAAEKQRISEMIEGYTALAADQKEFAEIASEIESEVIPEW